MKKYENLYIRLTIFNNKDVCTVSDPDWGVGELPLNITDNYYYE